MDRAPRAFDPGPNLLRSRPLPSPHLPRMSASPAPAAAADGAHPYSLAVLPRTAYAFTRGATAADGRVELVDDARCFVTFRELPEGGTEVTSIEIPDTLRHRGLAHVRAGGARRGRRHRYAAPRTRDGVNARPAPRPPPGLPRPRHERDAAPQVGPLESRARLLGRHSATTDA